MAVRSVELLEREDDLAAIAERIEWAISGDGSVVIFEGPAGIGKTELLSASRAMAAAQGMQVLAARGGELERNFAFGVVRQLFEPAVTRAKASERKSLLAGAAAGAAPVLALPGQPNETARSATPVSAVDPALAVQHGLYWLAANLAEQTAILFSVDDAHWADAASLRWLIYLARRLEGLPIFVVVATRPGEAGSETELLPRLDSEPRAETRRPAALSGPGAARVVREALGDDAEEEFCMACHETTGGNPFVLRELTEAIKRDAIPPTAASAERIRSLGPETVSRSIMVRIVRLPGGTAQLARAIAILGPGSELHEAAVLAGLDETQAAEAADALTAAAILAPGRPLDFIHPVVRTSIYREVPEAERALAHSRAARLLFAHGARSERLAAHLLAAEPRGDPWVIDILRDAAQDALGRAAPDAAVAYLRRAIREPALPPARIELLSHLLTGALRTGDVSAFDDLGGEPLQELISDRNALLACGSELATVLYTGGSPERASEVWTLAIDAALERGDVDHAVRLELELINWRQIVPSEARARFERYTGWIEAAPLAKARWLAAEAWWATLIGDGPAGQAAGLAQCALATTEFWPDQTEVPILLGQAALVLVRADALDWAELSIARWIDEARARGSYPSLIMGSYVRAYLSFYRGDVAQAESEAREVVETARASGFLLILPLWIALLVETLIERGELDAADEEFEKSGMTEEIPDLYWFGPLLFTRGRLRVAQSRTREGLDDLLEHGRRYQRDGIINPAGYGQWGSAAAGGLASTGEPERARRLVEQELDRARRWGTPGPIGAALAALGLLEGGAEGIRLLREAVAVLEPSSARLEHARALTDLGAAIRRQGQRSEAREMLREALELAHRCGATTLAERARQELAATGARPRKMIRTGLDSLTASERRVAQMAAAGHSNKEIAQALFVTVKTVETHLRHAYQKLEIGSRSELRLALTAAATPSEGPEGKRRATSSSGTALGKA